MLRLITNIICSTEDKLWQHSPSPILCSPLSSKDLNYGLDFTWFIPRNKILSSSNPNKLVNGRSWILLIHSDESSASNIPYLSAKSENLLSPRIKIITVHWVLLFQSFLWQLATRKLLGNWKEAAWGGQMAPLGLFLLNAAAVKPTNVPSVYVNCLQKGPG